MEKRHTNPYAALDPPPQVLQYLFHPRRDAPGKAVSDNEHLIPVDRGIDVGATFHLADPSFPNILFFHGNGEIVSVGWVERSETQQLIGVGFRSSTQPTGNSDGLKYDQGRCFYPYQLLAASLKS